MCVCVCVCCAHDSHACTCIGNQHEIVTTHAAQLKAYHDALDGARIGAAVCAGCHALARGGCCLSRCVWRCGVWCGVWRGVR